MNQEQMIDLARRAVACSRWKWMPGMAATGPGWFEMARICETDSDHAPVLWEYRGYMRGPWASSRNADISPWEYPDAAPVLTDAATQGCIMALYEETRETLCCPDPVYTMAAAWGLAHPRTIEALIAALEAAPPSDQEREK
jgi:hypothetical protein